MNIWCVTRVDSDKYHLLKPNRWTACGKQVGRAAQAVTETTRDQIPTHCYICPECDS